MRILVAGAWRDGFLDYHRDPGSYRIAVRRWLPLCRLDDLYFVRPRDPRLVLNYVREIGPREVARKIRSRRAESARNEKWLACGVGTVLEGPDGGLPSGAPVVFVAPRHPACVERVVLAGALVGEAEAAEPEGRLLLHEPAAEPPPAELAAVAGWDPDAAEPLEGAAALERARALLAAVPAGSGRDLESGSEISERRPGALEADGGAAVFGYGNYSKTIVLPNLGRHVPIRRVHEIDPTQLPSGNGGPGVDTSPSLRDDERFDVYAFAGYHHTHAPLAAEALRRGAHAVVEKPLAVDRVQLTELLEAMRHASGELFACFHRRYMPANAWLAEDLGARAGAPVSCHCVVYEVPLPARHWYRWPSSHTRLVSNGCHWIDHFLFLNAFARPRAMEARTTGDGSIACAVELENSAVLTMALTERGSDRLGLRDYAEFTVENRTARLVDGARYVAEDGRRVIRRRRFNRYVAYRRMYDEIGRAIAEGRPGDTPESVEISAGAVLELEERLAPLTPAGRA